MLITNNSKILKCTNKREKKPKSIKNEREKKLFQEKYAEKKQINGNCQKDHIRKLIKLKF